MLLPFLAAQTPPAPPRVEIPASLVRFGTMRRIDALAARAGLPSLRKRALGRTDFELRIWTDRSLAVNPLGARILRRRGARYAAYELDQPVKATAPVPLRRLRDPKSGWPALWKEMRPLLTVRDQDALPEDRVAVLDGESVVVEIALPGRYRAFRHDNPIFHTARPDAVTLVRTLRLLDREFAYR